MKLTEAIDFLRESNNIEDEWDDDSLAQALFAWDYVSREKKLTPSVILKTHKILMLHHLVGDQKGYFRKQAVWIGRKEGKPWFAIPELVQAWCDRVNATVKETPYNDDEAESDCREDHIQYEAIHPFIDGNGRTGRIFYNWERLKLGLPIDVILEKEKYKYYEWFK